MSKITYIILFVFFLFLGMPSVISQTTNGGQNHHTSKKNHLKWNYNLQNIWAEKKVAQKKQSYLTYFKLGKNISDINRELLPFDIEEIWSENIILVYLKEEIDQKDIEQLDIIAFAPYENYLKHSPLLLWDNQGTHVVSLLISTIKNTSELDLAQEIHPLQGKIPYKQPWKNNQIWEIEIPRNKITELSSIPFIKYIQEVSIPEPINNHAIGFTNSGWANNPSSLGGYGLLGKEVTIGVGDNADPLHVDFSGRLISFNPAISTTHGEHTTGTVGGAGIIDQKYTGFAPKSNLISAYFSEILAHSATYNSDFGMVVTNNSYGMNLGNCGFMGTYNLYSQHLDQLSIDVPDLLHVFAAANDAWVNCPPYSNGFATVNGAYSSSKNALVVANIGKTREIINLTSSKGPVRDGRLKPEITAVGSALFSTDVNNQYKTGTGTSMAAPNIAGAAALLYERYRQLHNNQDPANNLIKNLLMNGADDIGVIGPDYHSGFGLMNIKNSLNILDNNQYFTEKINTNQRHTYSFTIPANTAKAKIMLSWNDPAAAPNQGKTLINDLNLKVIDPNNNETFPLILNPDPNFVSDAAKQGVDSINNTEQVVLYNPQPGNYTIEVLGYQIPIADQEYHLSYDINLEKIEMQYPIGGEKLIVNDSTYVYWEASLGFSTFNVSYSTDNGNTWQLIQRNIAPQKRALVWYIPDNIASAECLIKVERGNETNTSQPFTIIGRPQIQLIDENLQCPGNIKFFWNPINGISNYRIFKKSTDDMVAIAETTDTFFTIHQLSSDSVYWFSVAPVLNNQEGLRAVATSFQPNKGDCSEMDIAGDLAVIDLQQPQSGRVFTSTALTNNEPVILNIRNQDRQTISSYRIHYRINNNPWQVKNFNDPISPAAEKNILIDYLDFSDTGEYNFTFVVQNLQFNDPISGNDTLNFSIKHLPNEPIDFSKNFEEGFENTIVNENVGNPSLGFADLPHWDFKSNTEYGRIRNFINSDISIHGQKSISLDNSINLSSINDSASTNELIGTFNLDHESIHVSEIRLSFDYLLHGNPKFLSENKLWIRGSDQEQWIEAYQFEYDDINRGTVQHSGSISLNDIFIAHQQDFSTSTQIKFVQKDTSKIASTYHGNGLTIDDIELLKVKNDVELTEIINIQPFNCQLSDSVHLNVKVKNRVFRTIYDIQLNYTLNDGQLMTEYLDSLSAKDSIIYQFATPMDLSALDSNRISAWVHVPTDTYNSNDSILNYEFVNRPIINDFPYYQDFEENSGSYLSSGINNSWQYGEIASAIIKSAASGTKAWKTNIDGPHNPSEISFLYSPCFDISNLDNPYLSFMIATDFEIPEPDYIYDYAYLEYSIDGKNWIKFEDIENSYQLYDRDFEKVWASGNQHFWKVNSIPLPKGQEIISFRFIMKSDQGLERDGIAIDDIHIYDLEYPIFDSDSLAGNYSGMIPAGVDQEYIENGKISLGLKNDHANTEISSVQSYLQNEKYNADSSQFILSRMFVLNGKIEDNTQYSFYIEDSLVRNAKLSEEECPSCFSLTSVVDLGISNYDDPALKNINQFFHDNETGIWTWIPKSEIRYVPYEKGYIARFSGKYKGEFWFNNGGPTRDATINKNLFHFHAEKKSENSVLLNWTNLKDEQVRTYRVQRLDEDGNFQTIKELPSGKSNAHQYTETDYPHIFSSISTYRIEVEYDNGSISRSPVRLIFWDKEDNHYWVAPNPITDKIIRLFWRQGALMDFHYKLYDMNGKLMTQNNINNEIHIGSIEISSDLSPGIYILEIIEEGEKHSIKLVIY